MADQAAHNRKVREAYRAVFKSPEGEIVLADLEMLADMEQVAFRPGGEEANRQSIFRDGRKSVVQRIYEFTDFDIRGVRPRRREAIHE